MAELVVIGLPYWLGIAEEHSGSVQAARASGILEEIGARYIDIEPEFQEGEHPITAVNRALAAAVKQTQANGQVPLIFGGDCCYCLGMMKGLEDSQPDVLWYDAHGDFNTPETTPSGFLGGMPLAVMVGRGNQELMTGIELTPVAESKVYLLDGRDLDPLEAVAVRESDLTHLTQLDAVTNIDWNKRPVYVHFDGDVLRLEDHPAVSYPAKGGPTTQEAIDSLKAVIASADVKAVFFTLWNNQLEGAKASQESNLAVIRAVAEALRG
jgi:arginase